MGETTQRVSDEVSIRLMQPTDIDAVLAVEEASFRTPWSRVAFEAEIGDNDLAHYLVLEYGGAVVGYGGMWLILDEAHVTNIAVAPEFRRCGLGTRLVTAMIGLARSLGAVRMTLEVRASNYEAQKLYRRLGFVSHGRRPGYYTDTREDALIMWRDEPEA